MLFFKIMVDKEQRLVSVEKDVLNVIILILWCYL